MQKARGFQQGDGKSSIFSTVQRWVPMVNRGIVVE